MLLQAAAGGERQIISGPVVGSSSLHLALWRL